MLAEGQAAPDFTLPDQDGKPVTLSKLAGKPVVLYFYPKDNTPGCTKEACSFRDDHAKFHKLGAVVLGVSPDTVASHHKFAEKFGLPFPLLADPKRTVCEAYGVWDKKTLYGRIFFGVVRTTVLIDRKGRIAKVFPKVRVNGHSEKVLEALQAMK